MPASFRNPLRILSRGGNKYMIKKMGLMWHTINYRYELLTFRDCLDYKMKERIKRKIDYHIGKVREFELLERE